MKQLNINSAHYQYSETKSEHSAGTLRLDFCCEIHSLNVINGQFSVGYGTAIAVGLYPLSTEIGSVLRIPIVNMSGNECILQNYLLF